MHGPLNVTCPLHNANSCRTIWKCVKKQRISLEVNNLCWKWSDVGADINEDYASINLLSRHSCRLLTNSHIPVTTSIYPARYNDWFCNELRCMLHEHRFLILARTNNDRWNHKFKMLHSQIVRQRGFWKQKPGIMKRRCNYVVKQWLTQASVL